MYKTILFLLLFSALRPVSAQRYGIVIKGGRVIDPKNHIDAVLDVAVSNGKIVELAKKIDAGSASRIIDARGMFVVPGLIDTHTHDFYGPDPERAFCNGTASMIPDSFAFRSGVTTVVDAGSSGWRDFPVFKKQVIDRSRTRVLAFLNIVGAGMRGGHYEQDTVDMDADSAAMMAFQCPGTIVGIKLAHYNGSAWLPVDRAVSAGTLASIPVMVDFGESATPMPLRELFLAHMRPGDIFTHCFAELSGREQIVDMNTKKIKPFVWEARKRGIVFGVGYGEKSFALSQAIPAVRSGFYPNSLSTDMHGGPGTKMKDMLDIMSEFLAMGMGIGDVIRSVTSAPAQEIGHGELGQISPGAIADITILRTINGKFWFSDHAGDKIAGTKKFECDLTIKNGEIVYGSK